MPDGAALRHASREVMRRYARYWLEIFRLPVMPVDRLVDGMHDPTEQRRIIFDILASGRGVVIALPHMGNWDQARRLDHRQGGRFLHHGHGTAQARDCLRAVRYIP